MNQRLDLIITKKAKLKAKRRRARNEKKWRPFKAIQYISLLAFIVITVVAFGFVPENNYSLVDTLVLFGFIALLMYFILGALVANFTSHWVTDRLNERMWIDQERKTLNHFVQKAFGAGLNFRHADETAFLFVMLIDTIHNAKCDPKSGRVEFKVQGKGYHFANCYKNIVDREWPLDEEFTATFYDYTEPGLVSVLEAQGVQFEKCTLDKIKITDPQV